MNEKKYEIVEELEWHEKRKREGEREGGGGGNGFGRGERLRDVEIYKGVKMLN